MARYVYDKTNHVEIPITGDPDPTNFVGTLQQWQALTQAEKNLYDSVDLTDDYYDVEEELQSIADDLDAKQDKTDNNLDTTSKTVVGAVNELKGSIEDVGDQLKVGNDTFYFDYHDGKYGYNTSPLRGADTFVPFKDAYYYIGNDSDSANFMSDIYYAIKEGNNLISSYSSYNPVQLAWQQSYPSVNTVIELSDSIFNYAFLLCQGAYKADKNSGYNTVLIYPVTSDMLSRNLTLQCLMRDRNASYACSCVLEDDTHVRITVQGGAGTIYICGIPKG